MNAEGILKMLNNKKNAYHPYHWCVVSKCGNSTVTTPGKLWIRVPNDVRRQIWLQLANRDPAAFSSRSALYFCEDHFNLEKDMINYMRYKIMGSVKNILMKPDCVPSKFDCLTNRISKKCKSKSKKSPKKKNSIINNVHAAKDISEDAATQSEEHKSLQIENTQYSNGNFSDEVLYIKEESVEYNVLAENRVMTASKLAQIEDVPEDSNVESSIKVEIEERQEYCDIEKEIHIKIEEETHGVNSNDCEKNQNVNYDGSSTDSCDIPMPAIRVRRIRGGRGGRGHGGRGRGSRGRGRRGRAARAGPASASGGRGQDPLATGLDVRGALENYEERKTSTSPPVPPSPEQTSLGPHRPRASAKTQIAPVINYGSEDEDEEDDNDSDDFSYDVSHLTNLSMSRIDREFEGELDMESEENETVDSIVEKDFETTTVEQFHFDWRSIGPNEISGERRSKFVGEIKGRANYHYDTPYDAFTAIWSAKFMEMIVLQTNLYAQQYAESLFLQEKQTVNSRVQQWKDTTVDELYTFIAICLAMGIVVKSNIAFYWSNNSDIFSTPGFSAAMSLHRFQLLSTCLHFVNNNDITAENLDAQQAKVIKIRPVIDHLNAVLPQLYTLGQNLYLNEYLTRWKGRLSPNQHFRTKVAKRGIKAHEVCESDTGYLWRFEVHTGPAQEQSECTVSGSTSSLVLRLLSGLESRGHTIWMEDYYNSPSLSRVLKSLGFDCAGTLKPNRKFVPLEFSSLSNTSLHQNEIITCTSGDVDVMVWQDRRLVCLTSTYHGNAVAMYRGKLLPIVVRDYNLCMGGVDRKDRLLAMYPIERKRTRSWYKKYFQRLLNASVLNAYILFNRSPTSPTRTSHRQFRLDLIKELLIRHQSQPSLQSLYSLNRPLAQRFPEEILAHLPEQLALLSNGKERARRKCAHCGARTTSICTPCNAPLCTFTCFRPFHQT